MPGKNSFHYRMEYITLNMASFSLFEGEFGSTNIFITLSPLGFSLENDLAGCNVCGQFSTRFPQQPFYFPAQRSERNNSNNYARAILLTHKSFETETKTLKLSLNHRSRQHANLTRNFIAINKEALLLAFLIFFR